MPEEYLFQVLSDSSTHWTLCTVAAETATTHREIKKPRIFLSFSVSCYQRK
jgi:hypothetical protein